MATTQIQAQTDAERFDAAVNSINFDPTTIVAYAPPLFPFSPEEYGKLCLFAVKQAPWIVRKLDFTKMDSDNATKVCIAAIANKIVAFYSLPAKYQTDDILFEAIKGKPSICGQIESTFQLNEPEFWQKVLSIDTDLMHFIPSYAKTAELCTYFIDKLSKLPHSFSSINRFSWIPDEIKTEQFILETLEKIPQAARHVSISKITQRIALKMVECNGNAIAQIPGVYRSKELILKAIEKSPGAISYITTCGTQMLDPEIAKLLFERAPHRMLQPDRRIFEIQQLYQKELEAKYQELEAKFEALSKKCEQQTAIKRVCDDSQIGKLICGRKSFDDYDSFNLTVNSIVDLLIHFNKDSDIPSWKRMYNLSVNKMAFINAGARNHFISGKVISVQEEFKTRDMDKLKLMFGYGNTYVDNEGNSVCHIAAKNHDLELFRYLTDDVHKWVGTIVNRYGETPIHLLCDTSEESSDVVEILQIILLKTSCYNYVNKLNYNDLTALHYAVLNDNLCLTENLLKHSANPNTADKDGLTPIIKMCSGDSTLIDKTESRRHEVVRILLKYNASVTRGHPKTGMTPLHYACRDGDIEMAKILLENPNCNKDALDNDGKLPVFYAVVNGDLDLVRMLL